MNVRISFTFMLILFSSLAVADSISITVKPQRGLVGTTSMTLHDDGIVTVLTYESSIKITESSINIQPSEKKSLRRMTLQALDSYLAENEFDGIKKQDYSVSFSHSEQGVTKSISAKRININARKVVDELIRLSPKGTLNFINK